MEDYVEVAIECPNCEEQNYIEIKMSVYKCGLDNIEIDSSIETRECGGCNHKLTVHASGMLSLNIDEEAPHQQDPREVE